MNNWQLWLGLVASCLVLGVFLVALVFGLRHMMILRMAIAGQLPAPRPRPPPRPLPRRHNWTEPELDLNQVVLLAMDVSEDNMVLNIQLGMYDDDEAAQFCFIFRHETAKIVLHPGSVPIVCCCSSVVIEKVYSRPTVSCEFRLAEDSA